MNQLPASQSRIVSALLGLMLLVATAARADGERIESLDRIRSAAVTFVSVQSPPTARVEAAALDNRLRLPLCAQPLESSAASPAARGAWNIVVACREAGNPLWQVFVPVKVLDLQPVVVMVRPVAPGQPLTADALRVESRDVATLGYGYFSDLQKAVGQTLRRPVAPGAVLTPDAVAAQKLIKRGALVTLLGRSGSLEVRAQGKALGDGGDGERISVENLSSRKVVQGVVRDGGTVEVGL